MHSLEELCARLKSQYPEHVFKPWGTSRVHVYDLDIVVSDHNVIDALTKSFLELDRMTEDVSNALSLHNLLGMVEQGNEAYEKICLMYPNATFEELEKVLYGS